MDVNRLILKPLSRQTNITTIIIHCSFAVFHISIKCAYIFFTITGIYKYNKYKNIQI